MTEDSPGDQLHLVTLSHLAWEKRLFQRPQQLMSQFARMGDEIDYFAAVGYRRYAEMSYHDRIHEPFPNLRAQNLGGLPFSRWNRMVARFNERLLWLRARAPFVTAPAGSRVLWLQSPRFEALVDRLDYDLLVYDVMDPHSAFSTADKKVIEQEDRLLGKADLVFTGGRSLHELVCDRTDTAHCFPSGIDHAHFAKAADAGPVAGDVERLGKPVLGYFGAVDERIDWELIEHVCKERSHWSVVFIGPLVVLDKIPIEAPNFHWLGPRSYDALPKYLRGFDVCLIPWKVNELTRYMSPTKTPEYLAAGKPVVSTAIPDVMSDFPDSVRIGDSAGSFLTECTSALMSSSAVGSFEAKSWASIAEEMRGLMVARLGQPNR